MGLDQTAYSVPSEMAATEDWQNPIYKFGRQIGQWRKDWELHEAVCAVKNADPSHWFVEAEITQIDLDRIRVRLAGGSASRDPLQTIRFLQDAQDGLLGGKRIYYLANQ
jgi:hypothetical protein